MNKIRMNISHPREWPLLRIQDICIIVSRGTAPVYTDYGKVLAIGQRCVREWGFMINEARFHDQRYMNRALRPEKGDVLLNSTGTGTIGRSCVFHAHGDFLIDGHITLLRPDLKKLDGRWLNCILQSPEGQVHLETQCYSGSTNQVELSRERLMATAISLPPLPEQHRIAEILDTIDEAIKKTEALIEKLKAMKQGLLHDLLTRGLDENGKLRDPKTHPEQFKNSPMGSIPREWDTQRVESLLKNIEPSIRSGPFGSALLKSELKSEGVPLIGIDNVDVERFVAKFHRFVSRGKYEELKRYAIRPNDVMITIMGTVGRCCLAPTYIDEGISSKHVWTLTINNALYDPYLVCLQFNYAPWVLNHFKRHEQGGIMSAIRSETLRTALLPKPPRGEQKRISMILKGIGARIESEEAYNEKLKLQKKGLMHDLLTGKVRVKADFSKEKTPS